MRSINIELLEFIQYWLKANIIKLIIAYVVLIFIFGERGLVDLYLSQLEITKLQSEITSLEELKTELHELAKYNNHKEKFDYLAKDKLGLINKDETVVIIKNSDK